MTYASIDEFFASYDKSIDLVANHAVKGPIQYHLTGDGYCDWYLEINGVNIVAHRGTIDNPFSIIECDATAYLDLKNGKITHNDILKNNKMKLIKGIQNALQLSKFMVK